MSMGSTPGDTGLGKLVENHPHEYGEYLRTAVGNASELESPP